MLKAIQEQFSETPAEIPVVGSDILENMGVDDEVRAFEEENFVRTDQTKKAQKTQPRYVDELKNLEKFSSMAVFDRKKKLHGIPTEEELEKLREQTSFSTKKRKGNNNNNSAKSNPTKRFKKH
jgi:hypothetical protein